MKRILRALIRAVLDSEAARLAHECVEWRERALRAEMHLAAIAGLRPGARLERTEHGFIAHAVSDIGSRHVGAGPTAADAIRASGA